MRAAPRPPPPPKVAPRSCACVKWRCRRLAPPPRCYPPRLRAGLAPCPAPPRAGSRRRLPALEAAEAMSRAPVTGGARGALWGACPGLRRCRIPGLQNRLSESKSGQVGGYILSLASPYQPSKSATPCWCRFGVLLCHLVFKIGSPRVLRSVWATGPASWNWPFRSVVPCHLAFRMGLKSAVLYLHGPEALLYHLASWNCPFKGLMLCFSGPEVLTYAWLPQHRPSKRTPLCLCGLWGAAVSPQTLENSPSSQYRWAHACSPAVGILVVAADPVSLMKALCCAKRQLRKLE